jgi:hypothetical protein
MAPKHKKDLSCLKRYKALQNVFTIQEQAPRNSGKLIE